MRTKKQIINDYRAFLESKGKKTSSFSDEEIFTTLIEVLYDTEEINGKVVSSRTAWFHFVNFVVRYYVGTDDLLWNSFVKELFVCVEHHNLTALMASRGFGKTQRGSTEVFTCEGLKKIKDVVPGQKLFSYDENSGKIVVKEVSAVQTSKVKKVYRVNLDGGRSVEFSADHPVLRVDGWSTINKGLKEGDFIALPQKIPFINKFFDEDYAVFMGLMISEGCFSGGIPSFCNNDLGLIRKIKSVANRLGVVCNRLDERHLKSGKSNYVQYFSSKHFFDKFPELRESNSYTLRVPNNIFRGNKEVVSTFLKYLFEGDGGVEKNTVTYCSMSNKLVKDISLLLNFFGIRSVIKPKNVRLNGKNFLSYRLFINGDNVLKFKNSIGFVSERKQKRLNELYGKLCKVKRNSNIDVIPSQHFFKELGLKQTSSRINCSREGLLKKISKYRDLIANNNVRGDVIKRKEFIKTKESVFDYYEKICNSDICFDQIVSIEHICDEVCYDLQIGDGSWNYISNGIITHNSTVLFILYPLFKMFLYENTDVLLCANIPRTAKRNFRKFKRFIESNQVLKTKIDKEQRYYSKWGESDAEYNHGLVETISVGSSSRGAHVPLIILDDALRDDNKVSQTQVREFVLGQLYPSVAGTNGRLVVSGCVKGDTLITIGNGNTIPIVNLSKGTKGQYVFNELIYGECGFNKAIRFQENGATLTKKIVTKEGYELEGTHNHKIKVVSGDWKYKNTVWKRLDELQVGDRPVIKTSKHIFGNLFLTCDEAFLLGLYLADGSLESHRITITKSIKKLDCSELNVSENKWVCKDKIHQRLCDTNLINKFLDFGLIKGKCYEKEIPFKIFSSDKPTTINFLSGMFSGGGSISGRGISYSSTSLRMLKQLQQLLLKIGVISSINLGRKAGHHSKHDCYNLYILKEFNEQFLSQITFRHKYKNSRVKKYSFKSKTQQLYNQQFPVHIKEVADSKCHTFDFVIPEGHTYVSNGFISHNTPQSEKDILHEIMNTKDDFQGHLITDGRISSKGFYSKVFPAIKDYSTKTVLLPERYTWEKLMRIRKTVGEIRFAKEYNCRCLTDETAIFPESLIKRCIDSRLTWLNSGEKGKFYVIGCDLASSASKRADYTSFVVIEYNPDTKVKIIREIINERFTAEQQEKELVSLASKFNNAFVYIEKNNMGEYLRQKLINENVNVEGFTTTKVSKQNFIRFLRTELANKRLFFPPLEEQYEVVKSQLLSFGYKERRGSTVMEALSGHDDIVDALAAANQATQLYDREDSCAIMI